MEDARQVQPDQQHDQGQGRHHARRLKLEAPSDGLTRRPQRQKPAGQRQKADQHPAGEGQAVPARASRIVRRRRQRGRLHRQHREDARHQVQNQPAQQGQPQGLDECPDAAARRPGVGVRQRGQAAATLGAGQGRAGNGLDFPRALVGRQHARQGGVRPPLSGRQDQGQAVGADLPPSGPPHGRCGRRHRERNRPGRRRRPPAARRSRSGSAGRPVRSAAPRSRPGAARSRSAVRSERPTAGPGERRRRAPAGPATGSSAAARTSGRCTPETARPSSGSGFRRVGPRRAHGSARAAAPRPNSRSSSGSSAAVGWAGATGSDRP